MNKNNDKKNNDTKIAELTKKSEKSVAIEFNDQDLIKQVERKLNELPVLTEAEVDELRDASEDMLNRMVDKGCWLGLGFVRNADQDLSLLSAAHGNFPTLALMVAEAMDEDPVLEKVFLLALALKKCMDKMDETEDNEDEDYNEE